MHVIGLVGGVASGKSLVARLFEACGAGRLDGDRAAHEVLTHQEVQQALARRWPAPPGILTPEGEVDRGAVARIVFDPSPRGRQELEFLEKLTHPKIKELLARDVAALAIEGRSVAVLDAAVLLKAGWDGLCDKIVYVDAPREVRLERARQRGWSEEEFERREAAQTPLDEKRTRADYVIDNGGSEEATRTHVEKIYRRLLSEKPGCSFGSD